MATKVVMEALSPTMEEGRLVEWKKNAGDTVAVGDVLAEVETDKAVMELVARAAGTLLQQTVAAGSTVPVASTVGWIGAAGESIPGIASEPVRAHGNAPQPEIPTDPVRAHGNAPQPEIPTDPVRAHGNAPQPEIPTDPVRAHGNAPQPEIPTDPVRAHGNAPQPEIPTDPVRAHGNAPQQSDTAAPSARLKASPLARRIAADKGVNLHDVAGSGPEGRIIKRDVEQASAAPAAPVTTARTGDAYTDVALTQMRKTIAKRLVQSIGPIPTYYLTAEADMERAHEAREALLAGGDGKFSFNDLIIRAAAAALRQHPWVNAWWMDDKVRQWHDVHVGVAVAVEDGLITPVIRNADQKTLRQIAAEVRELAGRAREKKLKPEEYTGATFSISNLGMFGIDEFTAVINPPEAAILAVGRIEEKPVVMGGQIVARRRMRMTMSCDHRVIDGATGAAFLKTLVGMLENPLAVVW